MEKKKKGGKQQKDKNSFGRMLKI